MRTSQLALLTTFFSRYTRLSYKKGEMILRAEDTPSGVMYLEKGFVRMYFVGESGNTFVVHIFKPGAFFPMMWVLNDIPNTYYYEAMTPVTIWRAPREAAREFFKEHPEIVVDFASRLLTGVAGLLERVQHLVLDSAYEKLILLLLYYAKTFGDETPEGIVLEVPLTHKEISGWIGTTRETASLQMEALKAKGLIRYKGRQLIITSRARLASEVGKK